MWYLIVMDTPSSNALNIDTNSQFDMGNYFLADNHEQIYQILLQDKTTRKNILWVADTYKQFGKGYEESSELKISLIFKGTELILKPRINKPVEEQVFRISENGEVFTPSWLCNKQNNLIDEAWFGKTNLFNYETETGWELNANKIPFDAIGERTWENYVLAPRLEISCGEAPYLTSRYDSTTGKIIPLHRRIGLLDRKLRVINENITNSSDWISWSINAIKSIYGYEWQGDSLLLARKNILLSFIEYYLERFDRKTPSLNLISEIANIISWNLWQMDGMKFVVPLSCHEEKVLDRDLFEERIIYQPCEGCVNGDIHNHNGIYSTIKDWKKDRVITAVSLLGGKK